MTKAAGGRVTKAMQDEAYNAGRFSRDNGAPIESCPHESQTLIEKWKLGWTEADNTIAESSQKNETFAEEMPSIEKENEIVSKSEVNEAPATEHNFTDADVVEFADDLAALMQAFDNAGISIVETQFRALSHDQIGIATKWLNDIRIGQKRPVPEFLRQHSTPALIAFSDGYLEEQEKFRKVLMNCRFGKPSPTKPEGDDGKEKIKMAILVPLNEIQPGTAESLWGGMRCKVEFALRPATAEHWQNELPGTETVVSCVTEIKGYSRKMNGWQFSFLISRDVIDISDAFDNFWKARGSCRISPMDIISKAPKDEYDSNPEPIKSNPAPELPRQKSLLDTGSEKIDFNRLLDDDGITFKAPNEFLIPIDLDDHSMSIYVGRGPNDRFYASSFLAFVEEENECDLDYGNPKFEGDGCVTETAAIEKEIGSVIDVLTRDSDVPKLIDQLRKELKRLGNGRPPIPMPEGDEEDGDDDE